MINKKAKWEQSKSKKVEDLSSDIITNCLKTSNETLSLWCITDDSEIDDAIIALSSNRELIQKLDYIIIPDKYIDTYKLKLKDNSGGSPYGSFNSKHRDIININYSLLGVISEMILDIINNKDGEIVRVYEDQIKEKLKSALNRNILNTNSMNKKLLEKLAE